ncbi:MAG: GNAT family N-acetyltransferase [Chloroflexi bacterium]|nr:GNAT family N-acetyltransferase [Chloroflexota bacterium]
MDLVPADHFSMEELTDIYNTTRVDYLVPMPMSVARLEKYVHVYDVVLSSSVVAVYEDEPIGLCMLALRDDRAWITRLGVVPNTRRRGTGYEMMAYVLDEAARAAVSVVYLEVIHGNKPAIQLFDRLGFEVLRDLLILRRPPGPPEPVDLPEATITAHSNGLVGDFADQRPWRPAWTNQTESLLNAGGVRMLHIFEHETENSGWVSYATSALQLQRVIVSPDEHSEYAPAYHLLHALHSQFPALDTVAENVPGDSPYLDVFFEHGYVESFSRIEMALWI